MRAKPCERHSSAAGDNILLVFTTPLLGVFSRNFQRIRLGNHSQSASSQKRTVLKWHSQFPYSLTDDTAV